MSQKEPHTVQDTPRGIGHLSLQLRAGDERPDLGAGAVTPYEVVGLDEYRLLGCLVLVDDVDFGVLCGFGAFDKGAFSGHLQPAGFHVLDQDVLQYALVGEENVGV